MTTETFNLYSLLFTIIGFTFTFIGIVFIWRQIKQSFQSREVSILLQLTETSNSTEFNDALDVVWENNIIISSSNSDIQKAIKVCVFFELIGSIFTQKYTSTNLIAEFYGSLITGSFDKLEGFIIEYRKKPYNEYFAKNFEYLAKSLKTSPVVSRK